MEHDSYNTETANKVLADIRGCYFPALQKLLKDLKERAR